MGYFSSNHFKSRYFVALIGIGSAGGPERLPSAIADPFGTEPDAVVRYGRFTLNDYIGTHVQDELYRAINSLRWTLTTLAWHNRVNLATSVGSEQNRRVVGPRGSSGPDGGVYSTWDDLWAYLLSDKAGRWGTNAAIDDEAPYAYSDVVFVRNASDTSSPSLYRIDRCYAYAHITLHNRMARSFDVLLKAQTGGSAGLTPYIADTFNANGDGVADGVYKIMDTIAATTDPTVVSGQIGQRNAEPTFTSRPASDPGATPGDETAAFTGWITDDAVTLVKWDVSGGLAYVD